MNGSSSLSPSGSLDSSFLGLFPDSYSEVAALPQVLPAAPQAFHDGSQADSDVNENVFALQSAFGGSHTMSLDDQYSGFPTSTGAQFVSPRQSEVHQPSCSEDMNKKDSESTWEIARRKQSASGISPFDPVFGLMTTTNNTIITDSLLGIYHDVLENNLACWLAENTCPYKVRSQKQLTPGQSRPKSTLNNMRQTGGATWSNQIYHRVTCLDRVARKTGQLHLTHDENRAASKALSLAIMAFATQWSQGKPRRETHRLEEEMSEPEDQFLYVESEFEQNIKDSTWQSAKRALQACAEVESYRVIYAELIFGLVQKPVVRCSATKRYSPEPGETMRSKRQAVMNMLASQNQSAILNRATRKAHAMKFRLDTAEIGFSNFASEDDTPTQLSSEERSTIGRLYWLAVMLDTVSSSIGERPVALADEDCQHEDLPKHAKQSELMVRQRWEASLFVQDDLNNPSTSPSWPCDIKDAAEAVTRSAPVKVLLFRYISYLQNALRKRDFGQPIEEVICGALLLYTYWNRTYGSFFLDLIRDYETVPPRIKSWFVCIVVPWHLGALMLADLILFVDKNGMGLAQASNSRLEKGLHSEIRETSANELADIANVTTPTLNSMSGQQLPEMHFAVNQGSMLTEPWTILLVNAFARAGLCHLETLDSLEKQGNPSPGGTREALRCAIERVESCAQCLRFLGRKTEIAEQIACVLFNAIRHHRQKHPARSGIRVDS